MRLICPSCAAQYEVADDAIPPQGRDVECAACGTGWHAPGLPPLRLSEALPEPAPQAPPAPRVPHSVLAVLREEAEREIAARKAERPEAAQPPGPATARPRGRVPSTLPDPTALAASLTWSVQDAPAPQVPAAAEEAPEPPRRAAVAPLPPVPSRRPGYAAGFSTAVAVAALLVGAYVAAPHAAGLGRMGTGLMQARDGVDSGRIALQARAARLTDKVLAVLR